MQPIHLAWVDYTILLAYVAFVVGIGWALARYMKTSSDFLTSARSIPTWVTGLAFISANLGALELVGMAASGAKYGIATSHFYWVGAIPAMVFLAVFMMPFYYGSKARSVPEYLQMRFDGRVMTLNALAFAVMTVFASGISMNALAKLLNQLLGWDYSFALVICSGVVLIYVLKGGLTSAIYTEVLQFFMIVLGFAPVVYLGLKDTGGWHAMKQSLQTVAANPAALQLKPVGEVYQASAWTGAWKPLLAGPESNPMGVDWIAMVFGLGFVLSFGYWCCNFLVVQRAMAAKNMTAARNTPLVAAVPKMLFPILVILPGMIAIALAVTPGKNFRLPPPPIDSGKFAAAVEVLANAPTQDFSVTYGGVSDALGMKMSKEKIQAVIQSDVVASLHSVIASQQEAQAAVQTSRSALKQLKRAGGASRGEIAGAESKVAEAKNALAAADKKFKATSGDLNERLRDAVMANDYDGVIFSLVKRYCPPGLLGLALTALLASFMSGMAGNVTAFNTVWTYNLYQSGRQHFVDTPRECKLNYKGGKDENVILTPKEPADRHFLWMGKFITVVGILLSIACAYFAKQYNNAMDIIQLVFAFANAPLFATFLFGMFWKRTTATGAFYGLFCGIAGSAVFHALTIAEGNIPGLKGGYIHVLREFPSEMAQNFWLASFAFAVCFVLTLVISLATVRTKSDEELKGLVYSLTPKIKDENAPWYQRPAIVGTVLIIACVILNIIFW
jgi:solute:Na+ symporter, SSS family